MKLKIAWERLKELFTRDLQTREKSDYALGGVGELSRSQIERYKENMEVAEPPGEHEACEDLIWTRATGVWCCRDCNVWYRTWEDHPNEVKERQKG